MKTLGNRGHRPGGGRPFADGGATRFAGKNEKEYPHA
jgi:hypothetical protein